jgi:hypothetical protein
MIKSSLLALPQKKFLTQQEQEILFAGGFAVILHRAKTSENMKKRYHSRF